MSFSQLLFSHAAEQNWNFSPLWRFRSSKSNKLFRTRVSRFYARRNDRRKRNTDSSRRNSKNRERNRSDSTLFNLFPKSCEIQAFVGENSKNDSLVPRKRKEETRKGKEKEKRGIDEGQRFRNENSNKKGSVSRNRGERTSSRVTLSLNFTDKSSAGAGSLAPSYSPFRARGLLSTEFWACLANEDLPCPRWRGIHLSFFLSLPSPLSFLLLDYSLPSHDRLAINLQLRNSNR